MARNNITTRYPEKTRSHHHNFLTLKTATKIKTIRRELQLSQAQFAKKIGISVKTLQDWEQARRSPQGPARALLQIIAKYPEILAKLAKDL